MIAHHEALVLLQAGGSAGLSGFAAVVTARWYLLSRRTRRSRVTVLPGLDDGDRAR